MNGVPLGFLPLLVNIDSYFLKAQNTVQISEVADAKSVKQVSSKQLSHQT